MLNSSHIQRKLEQGPGLKAIFNADHKPGESLDLLYLTILSRLPTHEERTTIAENKQSARSRREAAIDIPWALINSPEFLYRH